MVLMARLSQLLLSIAASQLIFKSVALGSDGVNICLKFGRGEPRLRHPRLADESISCIDLESDKCRASISLSCS